MSILDALCEFSDAQSIKSSTGDTLSTDQLDVGANGVDGWGDAKTLDIGENGNLIWNVQVNTVMVGSGDVTAKLVTKASSKSVSTSGTVIAQVQIFAKTSAAGTKRAISVPAGTVQRYTGVVYTIGTAAVTSSKFDSWLSLDHQT